MDKINGSLIFMHSAIFARISASKHHWQTQISNQENKTDIVFPILINLRHHHRLHKQLLKFESSLWPNFPMKLVSTIWFIRRSNVRQKYGRQTSPKPLPRTVYFWFIGLDQVGKLILCSIRDSGQKKRRRHISAFSNSRHPAQLSILNVFTGGRAPFSRKGN